MVNEPKLDKEIKSWLAFAAQKVVEVNALAKALAGEKDEVRLLLSYISTLTSAKCKNAVYSFPFFFFGLF